MPNTIELDRRCRKIDEGLRLAASLGATLRPHKHSRKIELRWYDTQRMEPVTCEADSLEHVGKALRDSEAAQYQKCQTFLFIPAS